MNAMFIEKNSKLHISSHYKGGTIINVIVVLVLLGLMAFVILKVMKSVGQAGGEYATGMVNTQNKATLLKCQINLQTIWKDIQIYSISEDKLPDSFEDLSDYSSGSSLFRCPEPNSPKYVYILGQRPDSPPENILVYEPQPVHNGLCNILCVNGNVEMITPEQLQAAVEQTKAHLRE